jgi:hypothetical protein
MNRKRWQRLLARCDPPPPACTNVPKIQYNAVHMKMCTFVLDQEATPERIDEAFAPIAFFW